MKPIRFTSTQAREVIDYCMTHGPKFDEYRLFLFGGDPLMNFEVMADAIDIFDPSLIP